MSAAPVRVRAGLALLAALFVASLALRPQLVGVGPLLPEIEADLGVSHAVAGLLSTIPVICMAVFAPAAAPLTAWASLRTAIAACVFGVAAFGLARAAAPGAGLVLALTLPVGIGIAVAGALLPIAVKARFADRPAFGTGVYTTGLSVGAALASLLAVPLADAFGGWRGALAAFSAATVVLAVGWLVLSRGTWTERSEARAPRLPFRRGIVWGIVAVFGLQSAIFYAFVSWMPDAFQERGWSAATAGALAAVFGLAALPTGLLVPWLADRAGSRRLWLVGSSAVTVAGLLGLAALPEAAFAWATIAGAAIGAVFPLSLTLCLDVARDPADAGAVAALVLLGGYLLVVAVAGRARRAARRDRLVLARAVDDVRRLGRAARLLPPAHRRAPEAGMKVFLSCAVTGGMSVPSQSAAIPITPEQIVDAAVGAHAAGAAIVHIHVRDPETGKPSPDLGLFREVLAGIGERCDAIVQPTTGGGVGMTIDERARVVTECRPEMATFNCGSFNFGIFKVRQRPEMAPWEVEYLEGTRDYVFRNTFAEMERLCRAVPRGRHEARVRVLRRRPPAQPAPPRRGRAGRLPAPHPVRARRAGRQRGHAGAARAHAPHRDRPVRRPLHVVGGRRRLPGRVPARGRLADHGRARAGRAGGQPARRARPPRGVERRAGGEGV